MLRETEPDAIGNLAFSARAKSPAPGWVNVKQACRMFSVSQWTWDKWVKDGKITCGQPVGLSGRLKHYRIEELRAVIETLRAPQPFPPPGMVDRHDAPRVLGVSRTRFSIWEKEGRISCGRIVSVPGKSGVRKIYPIDELRRAAEQMPGFPPPGWLDATGAARLFGVAPATWNGWVTQRKVRCGKLFANPTGGRCYLFAEDDVKRLMEEIRAPDKTYWDPHNPGYYHIPPGFVRQRDAWRMFGVDKGTWKRWERERQITCGKRVHRGGPKLYPLDELQRLLAEFGRYVPPYADPQRPGCYRVPLTGTDIRRREAIIDAETLSIVQGERWGWCAGPSYGPADVGYVAHSTQEDKTALHRIILNVSEPLLRVVHLNGDPLDCRRANLAVKTIPQQVHGNRPMKTHAGRPVTSKYKGVCWDKRRGKWVAQIKKAGTHRYIGRFDDELAAAEAYDQTARELFGEHAYLNFPDGIDAALQRGVLAVPPRATAA
jgi:hypothetical protein